MKPQDKPQQLMELREAWNITYLVLEAHAQSIIVFTRHTFGSSALGWTSLRAIALIWLSAFYMQSPTLELYMLAFIGVQILQRIRFFWVWMKGRLIHSHYGGTPVLSFIIGYDWARRIEPLLVYGAGYWIYPMNPDLGKYLMFGFFSLYGRMWMEWILIRKRITLMTDQQIEMEYFAREAGR